MQSKMSKDSGQSHYVQGLRYLSGTDFEQNFELALFHFRKAAIENHIEAQMASPLYGGRKQKSHRTYGRHRN